MPIVPPVLFLLADAGQSSGVAFLAPPLDRRSPRGNRLPWRLCWLV